MSSIECRVCMPHRETENSLLNGGRIERYFRRAIGLSDEKEINHVYVTAPSAPERRGALIQSPAKVIATEPIST